MLNGQNLSINYMIVAKELYFSAIYLQKKATFSVYQFFRYKLNICGVLFVKFY